MCPMSIDIQPAKKLKLDSDEINRLANMNEHVEISGQNSSHDIDESLYSRQLYVLGHDAMRRMARSDVIVCGLNGLGAEIAKNVILGGVKSVTLHDTQICQLSDLGSQFYLTEDDIGKNRALASYNRFAELNTYVPIRVHTEPLTENFLKQFQVIVIADHMDFEQKQKFGDFAHQNQIAFIVASSNGLFGQIFCDFGENFVIYDSTGETPISTMIASISHDSEGIVTCLDETRHGLEDGDFVTFSEVEGMIELNNCEPRKIEVLGPYTFKIGETSQFNAYNKGGIVTQVKKPKTVHFKSFSENFFTPEILQFDFSKLHYPQNLHLAYYVLDVFIKQTKRYPQSGNNEDVKVFLEIAKDAQEKFAMNEIDEKLLTIFANIAKAEIGSIDAIIGGIVAQEVMKACSGKFTPIMQWFYFDAIECLPTDYSFQTFEENTSRYQGQLIVFGEKMQEKLANLKYFVVGAGAIGCELLKNFAMMGLGNIIVTDMDLIEKSNLNRQFLFRPHNVQCSKSIVAAEAVKKMNQNLNIEAHENRVGTETENVYTDAFFEKIDGVANALDNIEARTYMDRRCVYYRVPLLESGTLGTKGNTQVVVPFLTESYSSSQDPPEKSIPICTLKNFPNAIEHTLQWARDNFEGIFKHSAENAAQFVADKKFVDRTLKLQGAQPLEILESVVTALVNDKPVDFFDCVKWARNHFEEQYTNQIKQLLFNFPSDQMTTTGQLFWSGPKRCPEPIVFDLQNSLHVDYIFAASNLKAEMYGIDQNRNRLEIIEMVQRVEVPVFVPKSGVRIAETDAQLQMNNGTSFSQDRLIEIQNILSSSMIKGVKIFPIEFEKDDDHNLHMDFIVAASNLRATNYRISLADRHKSKLIAGKIIPAIATTTSVVAGLATLEIFKLHTDKDYKSMDVEKFRNSFINLALPYFGFSEPVKATKLKYYDIEWTLWDRFEVQGDMTLQEFLKYFEEKHRLNITMLSQGVCMLYSFFLPKQKVQERLELTMSELVKRVSKKPIESHVNALVFEIVCDDADGNDVEIPYVRYILPPQSE